MWAWGRGRGGMSSVSSGGDGEDDSTVCEWIRDALITLSDLICSIDYYSWV